MFNIYLQNFEKTKSLQFLKYSFAYKWHSYICHIMHTDSALAIKYISNYVGYLDIFVLFVDLFVCWAISVRY